MGRRAGRWRMTGGKAGGGHWGRGRWGGGVGGGRGERLLQLTGMREYAQACGALADDVRNGRWRHLGQGPVDAAVAVVRMRPLADLWAWSWSRSEADISPLEAITLARHGYMTHGVRPPAEPDIF